MRSVLIIFGVVLLILGVSILFSPRKDLVDDPAGEAYKRQQEFDRKDAEEAQKKKAAESAASGQPEKTTAPAPLTPPAKGNVTAVVSVKDRGDFTLELFAKDAPKTVAQIAGLMKKGFYNGIIFHRVEPEFVVQAGNPATKTQGVDARESDGGVPPIPFETNNLQHDTGTLGIALTSPRSETGTSQFFINLKPNHSLDGDYCVFGRVASGMDVVNKIQKGDVITKVEVK
jgi:peptidyl-prolyl cis-trans isomerase B (cyclophilin B)